MKFACAHCGKTAEKPAGHVNRSRTAGLRLFCGRRCFGLDRRQHKTKAQRVAEKKAYDAAYRAKNLAMLKAKKRAHHKRTYDPAKGAVVRKKRMPLHVQYCRRPEYKRWKHDYDRKYRSKREYGPFVEAAMLAVDLNREVKSRSTDYEIRSQNGTLNKTQRRRRETNAEGERHRYRTSESVCLA